MQKMDPATLRKALEQLQQATDDHADWHANLLRAIFCGTPCDPNDLTQSAHLNCRFGHWYYERTPPELQAHPSFAAIGREHHRLHQIGARLLREVAANVPVIRANFEDLVAANARLRLEMDRLKNSVEAALRNRDALTGAYGRLEMLPELRALRTVAQRTNRSCCIAFMDIDRLKYINDTFGHQVGDGVLAGAVRYAHEHLRTSDKMYRYGGDEFLIVLPGADLATGQAVITRVREGLARRLLITGPGATSHHVTASFGLALLDPDVSVIESINRADQALLLAKTAGRNGAISWDESVTTSTRWKQIKIDDVPI